MPKEKLVSPWASRRRLKGYPPSVFSLLPKLIERTGPGKRGGLHNGYLHFARRGDDNDPVVDMSKLPGWTDRAKGSSRCCALSGNRFMGSISRLMPPGNQKR